MSGALTALLSLLLEVMPSGGGGDPAFTRWLARTTFFPEFEGVVHLVRAPEGIGGTLVENQAMTVNTAAYNVHTLVQFVDDATDGTLGAGTDLAPNDYKQVTITVTWGGGSDSEKVVAPSLFSLDGVESVAAGTGIVSVNVLDTAGLGVANASVRIVTWKCCSSGGYHSQYRC